MNQVFSLDVWWALPVILDSVLQQLGQLQWVFTDLLYWCEQKAVNGNVHHLLLHPAGVEKVLETCISH